LNILPLPDDGRHVLVATSGYNAHELSLIDLEKKAVVDRQAVRESWFGLAASPRFDRIWWSGGGGNVVHRSVGGRPYDVVLARNGNLLYVSDWAGRAVHVVDPSDLRTTARIAVGEHPNQLAVHPSDDRLFVACASSDTIAVIDTRRGIVTETIHTALFPRAPEGSTPDALAIAPDGKTLFVANADNNCVAVIDIATPSRSGVKGFIPHTPNLRHVVQKYRIL